jgi:hypothetical protein
MDALAAKFYSRVFKIYIQMKTVGAVPDPITINQFFIMKIIYRINHNFVPASLLRVTAAATAFDRAWSRSGSADRSSDTAQCTHQGPKSAIGPEKSAIHVTLFPIRLILVDDCPSASIVPPPRSIRCRRIVPALTTAGSRRKPVSC